MSRDDDLEEDGFQADEDPESTPDREEDDDTEDSKPAVSPRAKVKFFLKPSGPRGGWTGKQVKPLGAFDEWHISAPYIERKIRSMGLPGVNEQSQLELCILPFTTKGQPDIFDTPTIKTFWQEAVEENKEKKKFWKKQKKKRK